MPENVACSLAEIGWRRRERRTRSDASLTGKHDSGYLPAVRSWVTTEGCREAKQSEQDDQLVELWSQKVPIGAKIGWGDAAKLLKTWWPGTELNRRRQPFQGCALPPELPGHFSEPVVSRAG
jgi:hypothetical protein